MGSNLNVDYIIIGGGIFGCSLAYNLVNQGAKNIVVLEIAHDLDVPPEQISPISKTTIFFAP